MNHIVCKILALHGDDVELEVEGQKITISKKQFPDGIKEKDSFQLILFSPKYPSLNEKQLTKSILEEILNGK